MFNGHHLSMKIKLFYLFPEHLRRNTITFRKNKKIIQVHHITVLDIEVQDGINYKSIYKYTYHEIEEWKER